MNNLQNRFLVIALLVLISQLVLPFAVYGQGSNIKNNAFRYTVDGKPIYSQGGGIFRFPHPATGEIKYFWYGVHYLEAETYRNDPSVTLSKNNFESVTCYSSDDLVHWTFEGDVLTKEEVNKSGKTWVGRLGVAFIREVNQYVLVVQHGNKVMFAVADSPTGQFRTQHERSMESMIGTSNTGDQTVFSDEDTGKSYLVYSYGKGRNKIYVSEIGVNDGKVDLLDCTKIFQGESREGNCMFKYNNKYYMFASNIYGWDASFAYYLVADDIRGPYLPTNKMLVVDGCEDDFAHVSQTGFFVSVKGSEKETIVYCGDRWANFAGNGLGYNQWCPMSFDGKTPYFNSLDSWNLDAKTGNWEVAADNNYAKNGSFEADRRHIPSRYKPVQVHLTGWASSVVTGSEITPDSLKSPVLNYFNTESDRKSVIGEKSLNISDKTAFKRKVYQTISSSPYVKLPDGNYTMTAKVKVGSGFQKLEMYAESAGSRKSLKIKLQNSVWTTVEMNNIKVQGGKAEIGFWAEGNAGAQCQIDDVAFAVQSQTSHKIDVTKAEKAILRGHLDLGGRNPQGDTIGVNSFYLERNEKPFIPVIGEFHFSRYPNQYWDEQLKKMKAGGITVVATYVFWNMHEFKEGKFDWTGDLDVRRFTELCADNGLEVIMRAVPGSPARAFYP